MTAPRARRLRRWGSLLVLSSLLPLLGLTRPALAQQTACSETSTAITDVAAVMTGTDVTGLVMDCTTLLGLKDTLRGTATLDPDWAESTAMDTWDGITVAGTPPRVTELDLREQSLTGTIPAALGDLAGLEKLYLALNQLTGSIPPELGDLANLTILYLSSNDLDGPIPPELGNLTNLKTLYLLSNQFTGPIPRELGNLTNLEDLWLQRTPTLDGPIPPELGNLANLKELNLHRNAHTGSIPSTWGTTTHPLPNLKILRLNENDLDGSIPAALGRLVNLEDLTLNHNQLDGPIPAALGNLTNLLYLWLSENALTGPIPPELGNLTKLFELRLNSNDLTGPIPESFGSLSELDTLWLFRNNLSGPIPEAFGTFPFLVDLRLHDNDLTGPIPAFDNSPDLRILWLQRNNLEGPIPDLSSHTDLENLILHANPLLSGDIPTWLEDLTNLQFLYLGFTGLSGPIPVGLGTLPDLVRLHLAATDWTGTIPQAVLDKQATGDLTLWTNRYPTPPAVEDQAVRVGDSFTYAVTFTDRDADTLTYYAHQADEDETPLPAWLLFDRATGTLSGTPPTEEVIEVEVIATDEDTWPADGRPCDPDRDEADDEMNPPRLCAAVTFRVVSTPMPTPAAPTDLTAEVGCADSEGLVVLRWDVPPDPFDGPWDPNISPPNPPKGRYLYDYRKKPYHTSQYPPFSPDGGGEELDTYSEWVQMSGVGEHEGRLRYRAFHDLGGDLTRYTFQIRVSEISATNAASDWSEPSNEATPVACGAGSEGDGGVSGSQDDGGSSGGSSGSQDDGGSSGGVSGSQDDGGSSGGSSGSQDDGGSSGSQDDGGSSGGVSGSQDDGGSSGGSSGSQDDGGVSGSQDDGGSSGGASGSQDDGGSSGGASGSQDDGGSSGGSSGSQDDGGASGSQDDGGSSGGSSGSQDDGGASGSQDDGGSSGGASGSQDDGGSSGGASGSEGGGGSDAEPNPAEPPVMIGYLENPGPDSFQSGIGVISGWVCDAETVEIEIGDFPTQEAAYGTERADTQDACGDTNNGFGLLFNWNLLGDGEHTVVALVDGEELARATVTVTTLGAEFLQLARATVTTLGAEFLQDVAGECEVANFPRPGETVTLAWQQTSQNFVLTSGSAPSGENRAGVAGMGYLENPGPNSFQSGIGILSGWVCDAEVVELEIDGGVPITAAYGTDRADTAAVCGDTDNGFGLLFNWNLLGDGEHTVVALVDGEELGRATVRVTTLGTEFLRGAEGECTVTDFPMLGETVTLEWQQNSQNFVITDFEQNFVITDFE